MSNDTARRGMTTTELQEWFASDKVRKKVGPLLEALGVKPDRFLRLALINATQTPKLRECDPWSICFALTEAAALGLEPNGVLGLAYLVPYWNEKKRRTEAKFQIGYQGMGVLAQRSPHVGATYARAIYERDEYEIQDGTGGGILHRPYVPPGVANPMEADLSSDEFDSGPPVGYYHLAFNVKGGPPWWEWMTVIEVERIRRNAASSKGFSPWTTHYEAMARKTVFRRNLWRNVPLDPKAQAAIAIDQSVEGGDAISLPAVDPDILTTDAYDLYPEAAEDADEDDRTKTERTSESLGERATEKELRKLRTLFDEKRADLDEMTRSAIEGALDSKKSGAVLDWIEDLESR